MRCKKEEEKTQTLSKLLANFQAIHLLSRLKGSLCHLNLIWFILLVVWGLGGFCVFYLLHVASASGLLFWGALRGLAEVGRRFTHSRSWAGCQPVCLPGVCGAISLTSTIDNSGFGISFVPYSVVLSALCTQTRERICRMNWNAVITHVLLCNTSCKMYRVSILLIKSFFQCC